MAGAAAIPARPTTPNATQTAIIRSVGMRRIIDGNSFNGRVWGGLKPTGEAVEYRWVSPTLRGKTQSSGLKGLAPDRPIVA